MVSSLTDLTAAGCKDDPRFTADNGETCADVAAMEEGAKKTMCDTLQQNGHLAVKHHCRVACDACGQLVGDTDSAGVVDSTGVVGGSEPTYR